MVRSMTGFGKASREFKGELISAELNSVNHRFVDIGLRMPYAWSALDADVKQEIRRHIDRGKINISINRRREKSSGHSVQLDREVARQYVEAAHELQQMLGTTEPLSLNTLVRLEGVFFSEESEENIEELRPMLLGLVAEAMTQMNEMRQSEGRALEEDLRQRVDFMRDAIAVIEARLPDLNKQYEERLRARVAELQAEVSVTEERIAVEVAMLADKADVTEEVVRFKTHLDHMLDLLASNEPVGRRLDFLSQEIGREINTLGVKTRDSDVAKEVIRLKSELEKIREQLQNIE
jgi:uncharacterized protein (TIGR00255 family)